MLDTHANIIVQLFEEIVPPVNILEDDYSLDEFVGDLEMGLESIKDELIALYKETENELKEEA